MADHWYFQYRLLTTHSETLLQNRFGQRLCACLASHTSLLNCHQCKGSRPLHESSSCKGFRTPLLPLFSPSFPRRSSKFAAWPNTGSDLDPQKNQQVCFSGDPRSTMGASRGKWGWDDHRPETRPSSDLA